MKMKKHTFVICAYKESAFLEQCICSLMQQSVKSEIIMMTSTPNNYIEKIAEKYEIPLIVNNGEGGIVQDWNFGYQQAKTKYITIAHQDDIYFEKYTEKMLEYINKRKDCLIYFTNYAEIRNGKTVIKNSLLRIKRILLLPLSISLMWGRRRVRRIVLSFGCPICCPSVTFVKDNLPEEVFKVGFRSDEDWEAWENISKRKGSFIYNKEILVGHRIHEEAATSMILKDDARKNEDYIMFRKFWPKWIAKGLVKLYSQSEKSNEL